MAKRVEGWDVAAVLWTDACASMDDGTVRPAPMLSFGVPVWDKAHKFWRVVGEISAIRGGCPNMTTAVPQGMRPRVIRLARLPVPPEFQAYWKAVMSEA